MMRAFTFNSTTAMTIGLLATVITSLFVFRLDGDRRVLEFQKMSTEVQTDIQKSLDIYHELIADSAAAIGITSSISRNQFASFVQAIENEHLHPAMRAISWIPIVNDESRDQFENRANSEGLDNFQITQRDTNGQLIRSEERALYYPVFYIEPLEGNEPAIGFDLGSNQHRLDALSMSTATESTVATSPIELVQRQGSSLGFLIFSPVYVQNTGVLRGFVSGVFDIDVLVQSSLLSNQSSDIDIALIDESHDPLIPILNGTIDDGIFEERDLARPVSHESVGEIVLPNRVWKLVIGKSDGAFERSTWLWAVPLLGIITSIAIATSILAIERRRQVSEAFNLELEAVSEDLARLIDTANAPIFGVDINGKINEWNANIAATTGYSRDDVIGRDLVDALIPEENQSQVRAVLEAALVGEQTENYESPVVTSDGRTLQILLNSTTRRNGQGEIIGAVGVGQDVTERVRTEIERNRLFTEKADLIRQLLETQEEERAAIAYDLHDGPAQQLSGASMFIESYIAVKDEIDIVESDSIISKAKDSVGLALEEIQRIMAGLRPSSLDDLGLVQSLRESANEVSRRTGHSIEFITQLDERTRFDETIEIVLYRIAQEAVNNAVKHAGGGRVSVELIDRDGVLVLKVKDSGAGFDVDLMMTSADKRGMGLVGMRERAAMIGAGLTVTSRAGDGTLVTVELVSSTHGEFKHV